MTVVLGATAWYFREAIQGEALRLTLPRVDAPLQGTIRFAVIGDYGDGSTLGETRLANDRQLEPPLHHDSGR